MRQTYKSELAGQLGNLVLRLLSMIERYCAGVVPAPSDGFARSAALLSQGTELKERVSQCIERFAFHEALADLWGYIASVNKYIAERQPWRLAKSVAEATSAEEAGENQLALQDCLWEAASALAIIADLSAPFLPATSAALCRQLGLKAPVTSVGVAGNRIALGPHLFPQRPAMDEKSTPH